MPICAPRMRRNASGLAPSSSTPLSAARPETRVVYLESPGSYTFEVMATNADVTL